jgi:putative oxidoreductase
LALDNPGAYAGLIELVAGLLITLGQFHTDRRFLASGRCLAYWIAHAPQNSLPSTMAGTRNPLLLHLLNFVFAGRTRSVNATMTGEDAGRNRAPLFAARAGRNS